MSRGNDGEILTPFIMNDAVGVSCIHRETYVPGFLPEDLGDAVRTEPVGGKTGRGSL